MKTELMISGKTLVIGLLGEPVSHSLSPVMHNAALKEMGLDWCYIAMPCAPKNLGTAMQALSSLNFQGLNLTIPHKQTAISFCKEVCPTAQIVGAINTLIPHSKGGWYGMNTDIEGFLYPLRTKEMGKKRFTVLGTGGSARAVIAGLRVLEPSTITILGRTRNNLDLLLNKLANENSYPGKKDLIKGHLIKNIEKAAEIIRNSDLIINTTPVGMTNKLKEKTKSTDIPLGAEIWTNLQDNSILYDLIYNPRPTNWLTLGSEKGCDVIDGLEMLVQQGAASLRLWSKNEEIPIDIMRNAARNYLIS